MSEITLPLPFWLQPSEKIPKPGNAFLFYCKNYTDNTEKYYKKMIAPNSALPISIVNNIFYKHWELPIDIVNEAVDTQNFNDP